MRNHYWVEERNEKTMYINIAYTGVKQPDILSLPSRAQLPLSTHRLHRLCNGCTAQTHWVMQLPSRVYCLTWLRKWTSLGYIKRGHLIANGESYSVFSFFKNKLFILSGIAVPVPQKWNIPFNQWIAVTLTNQPKSRSDDGLQKEVLEGPSDGIQGNTTTEVWRSHLYWSGHVNASHRSWSQ